MGPWTQSYMADFILQVGGPSQKHHILGGGGGCTINKFENPRFSQQPIS